MQPHKLGTVAEARAGAGSRGKNASQSALPTKESALEKDMERQLALLPPMGSAVRREEYQGGLTTPSMRGQESCAPSMIALLHLRDPGPPTDSISLSEKWGQLYSAHPLHNVKNIPSTDMKPIVKRTKLLTSGKCN